MTDDPVALDQRRGMAAQRATDIRRRRGEVAADQAALRHRQKELEQRHPELIASVLDDLGRLSHQPPEPKSGG